MRPERDGSTSPLYKKQKSENTNPRPNKSVIYYSTEIYQIMRIDLPQNPSPCPSTPFFSILLIQPRSNSSALLLYYFGRNHLLSRPSRWISSVVGFIFTLYNNVYCLYSPHRRSFHFRLPNFCEDWMLRNTVKSITPANI